MEGTGVLKSLKINLIEKLFNSPFFLDLLFFFSTISWRFEVNSFPIWKSKQLCHTRDPKQTRTENQTTALTLRDRSVFMHKGGLAKLLEAFQKS